ncbi:MAG TPA: hypothetical protein VK806_00175 [Bacteroidia bacterium]|jgi:hypothetical protein|nr:hypothetical protein [Bacteroidia bacterium]
MSAFKGFQQTGGFAATVKPTQLFQGFTDTSFGQLGNIGGVPSTNLVAWFNPSLNITLGTGVSSWLDTTSTYNLTQAIGSKQPLYNLTIGNFNGRPYLGWTATQYLNAGSILNIGTNQYLDIVFITQINSYAVQANALTSDGTTHGSSTAGRYGFYVATAGLFYFDWSDNGNAYQVTNNIGISGLPTMYMGSVDRAAGKSYMSQNSNYRQGVVTTSTSSGNLTPNNFTVGANSVGGLPLVGDILDILIYIGNTPMSQTDYQSLRVYMGQIYGF